jgi:hypothetical protein
MHSLDAPQRVNMNEPNAARMYDHYLGGDNNFQVDRDAAEHVLRIAPWLRPTALENRAFLGRAVRYLAKEAGIRQFVDIGTGLPSQGNVHEVAHAIAPAARVVYADHDPIVLGQSRAMLARIDHVTIIRGDLRQPEGIISHPDLAALIDWDQPVALLLVAVTHFITNEDGPASILQQFREVMAPGSYIAITHIHHDGDEDAVRQILDIYRGASVPLVMRTRDEIAALFDGFILIEPGLVPLSEWRPDPRSYPAGVGPRWDRPEGDLMQPLAYPAAIGPVVAPTGRSLPQPLLRGRSPERRLAGLFVALEGIDGAGKTSAARLSTGHARGAVPEDDARAIPGSRQPPDRDREPESGESGGHPRKRREMPAQRRHDH